MRRTFLLAGTIGVGLILATSALAQGRSGGHAAGSPPFGTGASAGSRVGTPTTPASGGVGRDFGSSVRDSARVNRQATSHANEQAIANANSNAGFGTATATVVFDDDVAPQREQCGGRADEAQGSPFNPEGQAGEALANNPADPDEPIAVARYANACAHQPD